MGGRRKFVAAMFALAGVLAASVGTAPMSQAALSQQQKSTLLARRAQLVTELNSLLANQSGARTDLSAAETNYLTAQSSVLSVRSQLDSTNEMLATLQAQITSEQKRDLDAQRQLTIMSRANYENATNRSLIANLLSSNNFADAMARLKGADSVQGQVSQLQSQLLLDEADVARERATLQVKFVTASQLEKQLSDVSNQFMTAVANRNEALSSASGAVRAVEAQIADIDNQLAGNLPAVSNNGTCGNHFAYGQCTWYVATRRCIPWMGNADQWYTNARAMGYREGAQPAPGAVVVFWPGGDGASWVGHVAYVEVVGPDGGVPAGYFKLSEMNFGGWGRVNYRVLPSNSSGIQGFIYGHS